MNDIGRKILREKLETTIAWINSHAFREFNEKGDFISFNLTDPQFQTLKNDVTWVNKYCGLKKCEIKLDSWIYSICELAHPVGRLAWGVIAKHESYDEFYWDKIPMEE